MNKNRSFFTVVMVGWKTSKSNFVQSTIATSLKKTVGRFCHHDQICKANNVSRDTVIPKIFACDDKIRVR